MRTTSIQKGFSVIEVILAAAVFITFSSAAVVAIISGFNLNRTGGELTVATQFASEGLEAVRSIKNQDYSILTDTSSTGVTRNGDGVWQLSGANNTFDKYTRIIKIESVGRDATPPNGNIMAIGGGTPDPDTKKITATVTWNFTGSQQKDVTLTSYLTNWKAPIISSGGPIMMAYSKTTSTPFYRTWNGSSWSAEGSATAVTGNINYVVLKSSRTRSEAILGVQTSTGAIYVQVWNGTSWGSATQVGTGPTTTRAFDIAYERSNDRAVIAYSPSSGSTDFAYRTWDGNSLSSGTTVTAPPTTGAINWIELRQNPGSSSNDVAMIMLDANVDVYGMVWTGSTWSNMGVSSVWDATASIATKKAIDVEYEQTSGEVLFMWGDTTATDQYYRTWNGTTLTGPTLLDIAAEGGITEWVQLTARPNSNEIMLGVQDAGSDLNTRKWSGSAWDTATQHPEHDAAGENITSRNFDIVWETHSSNPGEAWLMWGDGATVSKKQWSGTAWGSASVLTGSDDTSFVRLRADSSSGAIFAGLYENNGAATDDIWESHLTGGSSTWSAENTIWGGPTSANPVYFRIDISTP